MATLSSKKPAKKKSNNIVKIKNDLVEAFVKNNNLTALKILFYIARTAPGEIILEDVTSIKMNTKDICEYCKLDIKTITRNLKQMQKTSISWKDEKAESFVSILPKCRIEYGGKIEITMFKEILQMILNVKNKYTSINVEQLMQLKSKHSARMILLLERIQGFSSNVPKLAKYSLEELNYLFGTHYKRLGEFEREVLKKVKIDLDKFSRISFVYEKKMDKEKVTPGRAKGVGIIIYLIDNNPQPSLF